MDRTFASLASPPGRGGIAVIALRGPAAHDVLQAVFRPIGGDGPPQAGQLRLGSVFADGQAIDQAIVDASPGRADINIHGGPYVAQRVLQVLAQAGAIVHDRPPADDLPTRHRQWDNPAVGAELLQLLPAVRTALSAAALSNQWAGGLSKLACRALDQARTGQCRPQTAQRLHAAAGRLATMRRLIEPPEVVLAGAPNAGKSTLANALIGRDVSIVDGRAGTTRDWVRELAVLDGTAVWLTDTAGLWEAPPGDDPRHFVERQSVAAARGCIERADLVVLLQAEPGPLPAWLSAVRPLVAASKADLPGRPARAGELAVSAATGAGLDQLKGAILGRLGLAGLDPAAASAFTSRQADLLTRAADALLAGQARPAAGCLAELLGRHGALPTAIV